DRSAAIPPSPRRRLALIAHGSRTTDLLDWARGRRDALSAYDLFAPGSASTLLSAELGLAVARFTRDAEHRAQRADVVIFLWDPLEPHPGDADVKALLHTAVRDHVPIACTRASADLLLDSPPLREAYVRRLQ